MEENKIYTVDIIDTNEDGMGIARIDSLVVFVPALVAGDRAEVRLVSREKNYARGECVKILEASRHRSDTACPFSAECGGCSLAHVTYEYENEIKKNTVKNALRRAGLSQALVEDTVYGESRFRYRNKLGLHYSAKEDKFVMYRHGSNEPVAIDSCLLCPAEMEDIVRFVNENTSLIGGAVKELFIRSSDGGQLTVSLLAEDEFDISAFSRLICSAIPSVSDVVCIGGDEKAYIHDSACGIKMRFSSEAFRQVNSDVFGKLLGIVSDFAETCKFNSAADLYCGSGIIGLSLAARYPSAHFWGVEINSAAIGDAKYNAAANNIRNIEFFCGDASAFGKKIPKNAKPELIVVDPPRAGLSRGTVSDIERLSPHAVIYVSCNPQTLARDLKRLCDAGYEVKRVVPVNMFPLTRHVETAVLLMR